MNRVLIFEDNEDLAQALNDYFCAKSQGEIIVENIYEGNLNLVKNPIEDYSVFVLDILLPGFDGYSLCSEIRNHSTNPVIFLSALSNEENRIRAYEMGADDYVIKPFSLPEFYLKIKAWIKRISGASTTENESSYRDIVLNLQARTCFVKEIKVLLTFTEFEILRLLISNKGIVVTREQILNYIRPDNYEIGDRIVDNHIKNLRKALGPSGEYIKTVRGVGYSIRD